MLNFRRNPSRRASPLVLWLTVWTLLLQILAPAMAQARTAAPLAIQVCSVHGFKTLYLNADGEFSTVPQQESKQDCRCCLVGAAAPPAVFDTGVAAKLIPASEPFTPIFGSAFPPDAEFLWHARLKQAPPLLAFA